jgi:calmodulin
MSNKFAETGDCVDEIIEAFQSFDTHGSGSISVKELTHMLTTTGEKLSDKEVRVLLDECDIENGRISYLQLSHMLYGATGDEDYE